MIEYMEKAYAIAIDAERKDLQTIAAQALAQTHIVRFELDEAEVLLARALELAGESGSMRARAGAALAYAWFLIVKGELDAAETLLDEVRLTSVELGVEPVAAAALAKLGWIARRRGDHRRAEKLLREALRIVAARGDRGALPDLKAGLATTLVDVGKVDEAERLALEQGHLDLEVRGVDQTLEDADIVRVHSVKRGLGITAEQKVHLLRAPMGGPPQRPAAAHSDITAGHDDGSRSRV